MFASFSQPGFTFTEGMSTKDLPLTINSVLSKSITFSLTPGNQTCTMYGGRLTVYTLWLACGMQSLLLVLFRCLGLAETRSRIMSDSDTTLVVSPDGKWGLVWLDQCLLRFHTCQLHWASVSPWLLPKKSGTL